MWGRMAKLSALAAVAVVAGWAVTASAATKDEIAKCEAMIQQMGMAGPHSHGADKGQGPSQMSAEHARCNATLAEAGKKADKK